MQSTGTSNRGLSLGILSRRKRNKNKRWGRINALRLVMYLAALSIVGLMLMIIGSATSELNNAAEAKRILAPGTDTDTDTDTDTRSMKAMPMQDMNSPIITQGATTELSTNAAEAKRILAPGTGIGTDIDIDTRSVKVMPMLDMNSPITREEIQSARISLSNAKNDRKLRPLRDIDRNKYTVRINTWRRNDLLIGAVKHVMTCPNVAQIQIVWCDKENEVPNELMALTSPNDNSDSGSPGIVIEKHDINSLNERYRILHDDVPTYGILSQDDDVVRSCLAMDIGFYRWTDHPDRMVGYDTRVHMINPNTNVWSYGYLSSTKKRNEYSLILPRYCFIHRDYLDSYIEHVPKRISQTVDKEFNCEDIALSFYVSALTGGKVPLLADKWAMRSMVKMNSGSGGISASKGHKRKRDACVNSFATLLGLKDAYAGLRQGQGANGANEANEANEAEAAEEKEFGVLMASPIESAAGGKYLAGADVDGTKVFEVKSDTVKNRKKLYRLIKKHYRDVKATKDHLREHMASLGLIK